MYYKFNLTKALVMTIPVLLLWNIKIPIGQKLLLLGLFSLTIITIIFSIIRVTFVTVPHMQPNIIWLAFWGNVEMPICELNQSPFSKTWSKEMKILTNCLFRSGDSGLSWIIPSAICQTESYFSKSTIIRISPSA